MDCPGEKLLGDGQQPVLSSPRLGVREATVKCHLILPPEGTQSPLLQQEKLQPQAYLTNSGLLSCYWFLKAKQNVIQVRSKGIYYVE